MSIILRILQFQSMLNIESSFFVSIYNAIILLIQYQDGASMDSQEFQTKYLSGAPVLNHATLMSRRKCCSVKSPQNVSGDMFSCGLLHC